MSVLSDNLKAQHAEIKKASIDAFVRNQLRDIERSMWGVPTGQIGRDITESKKQHFAIISGLEYDPELIIRVNNVSDITVLSHDIRRAVVHGVHLRYERQQNYLDIYFEKKQDYVLVKMFME